jgi:hypothetical protein
MFNFNHSTQEVNLVIQSLEHKIRDLTELLNKLVAQAQAQAPKPEAPVQSEETPQ